MIGIIISPYYRGVNWTQRSRKFPKITKLEVEIQNSNPKYPNSKV